MSSARTRSVGPLDPSGATPLPLLPGDLVAGRYEVLRLLGSGGSAFVYAVRDRRIGDELALKLLREGRRSDIDVERSRREAGFARGSASPRLVRTFDLIESEGHVFLTMELVSGGSLRDLLHDGQLPIDEVARLACEILEALAELHRLDIVHRDLKPGNLLLTPDGHIKLSDFGIARRWTDAKSDLTRTGVVVGTCDYLSPEQAEEKDVDPRSDLYSFGVVLFEMLAGRVPFDAASAAGALVMRLHRRPPEVRKLRPDTPRWLAAIVARLLATKREDRYASAEEVLEDFRRRRTRVRWRVVGAGSAALIVLIALGAGLSHLMRPDLARLVANGETSVRALDRDGRTLWTLDDVRPAHATIVRGGGGREVAAVLEGGHAPPPRVLSFLDSRTGHPSRTRTLPDNASYWFPQHSNRFGAGPVIATDLNRDGANEVLVSYGHDYWPYFVVLHDLGRDEARAVFVASGQHRIVGTEDLDGDGVVELIVEGIANRQGWYRALGAIHVALDRDSNEPHASTPDRPDTVRGRSLLWYALMPPGPNPEVTFDQERRIIRVAYEHDRVVEMTFDGFDPAVKSPLPVRERQAARERAYGHLRDSRRLSDSGDATAIEEAESARALAVRAGDVILTEWSDRLKGVALVRAGRVDEADAFLTRLAQSGTASEVAWDAAETFHLEGDLPRALKWYRRNLGREGQPGVGRMKYESMQGIVLVLGEMGRWFDAIAEIDRLEPAFAQDGEWDWYRRYVAWRTGETPAAAGHDLSHPYDEYRYWALEMALARGGDPERLLRAIDADRARTSYTRSLLLVARAEALRRIGRIDEALAVAREAVLRLRAERRTSVLARAHFDLAAERLAVLADAKGLTAEAKQARAEAAALRWHPNGIAR